MSQFNLLGTRRTQHSYFSLTLSFFFIALEKQVKGAKKQFMIVSCRIFLVSGSGVTFQETLYENKEYKTHTHTTWPALPPFSPTPCTGHSRIVMKSVNLTIKKIKIASKFFVLFIFFIPKSINDVKALYVVIEALQQLSANSLQLFFGCSITRLPVYHQINT